jgi:hypothetical protein
MVRRMAGRALLGYGLLMAAVSLALVGLVPVQGGDVATVLPIVVLLGLATGWVFLAANNVATLGGEGRRRGGGERDDLDADRWLARYRGPEHHRHAARRRFRPLASAGGGPRGAGGRGWLPPGGLSRLGRDGRLPHGGARPDQGSVGAVRQSSATP